MAARRVKRIDLALQGGGAHGAFTWGVLDRLLEDRRLEIDGVSGTSAGAMNAVVLASACLPLIFRAVEIECEAYWDGGYVGNPSLGVRPCSPTWGAVPRWTWALT